MKSYRFISYSVIAALLTTIVNPSYCQAPSWKERLTSSLSGAVPGVLKTAKDNFSQLAQSTASTLQSKVSQTISSLSSKLQDSGPKTIIPMLQESLKNMGTKIGSIAACMAGKGGCSSQERAAFIGGAVVVLALTALLVGYTATVAATSKEVDAQVVAVSQEVKGWSPQAVFTRLKNRVEEFKATLESLKECLIKRECTKAQKQLLYASAATIAALATVAAGVGVGSYLYTEKVKANEQAAQQAAEQDLKTLESIEGDTPEVAPSFIPSFNLPAFSQAVQGKLSQWQQAVADKLEILNTDTLAAAYETIKNGVLTGYIKSKEKAAELYLVAVEKVKQIPALLKETFGIDLASLSEPFTSLKAYLAQLSAEINSETSQAKTFATQVKDLVTYFKNLGEQAKKATLALKNLPKISILKAKVTTPEEYIEKKQELETELATLTTQHARIKTAYTKARPEDVLTEKKFGIIKKTTSLKDQLAKEYDELSTKIRDLERDKEKLSAMENFDTFFSPKRAFGLYDEIVSKVNGLQLNIFGKYSAKILNLLSSVIETVQNINKQAGKIGAILIDPTMDSDLNALAANLRQLAVRIRSIAAIEPRILTERLDLTKTIRAALNVLGGELLTFLDEKQPDITELTVAAAHIDKQIVPTIKKSLQDLTTSLSTIEQDIKVDFKSEFKVNPLQGIAHSPALLRNAVAQATRTIKFNLDRLIVSIIDLLERVSVITPKGINLLENLNNQMTKITQKPFVNQELISQAQLIIQDNVPLLATTAKKLLEKVRRLTIDLGS